VYVWGDGVHCHVRLEDDRLCTLVMIGVRPDGTKEMIAVEDGHRESPESWKNRTPRREAPGDAPAPGKVAMTPSPTCFTTVPWDAVTAAWTSPGFLPIRGGALGWYASGSTALTP
jgi:hypothetical protein